MVSTEFHTPPEHHALSHLSSSEDQNPLGFSAEKPPATARVVAGDETVSLGETETETEVVETVGNEGFLDGKSGAVGTVRLMNNVVAKLDVVNNGNRGKIENVEDIDIGGEKKPKETGDSSSSGESCKIVGEDKGCLKVRLRIGGIDKIIKDAEMLKDGHWNEGLKSSGKRIKEKRTKEQKDGNVNEEGVRSSFKRCKKKITEEDAEMQNDGRRNEGMRSSAKRSKKKRNKIQKDGPGNEGATSSGTKIVEIEDFRYVGDFDGKRQKLPTCFKGKETEAGDSLEKENQLLPLMEGKEKDLGEGSDKNSGSPPTIIGGEREGCGRKFEEREYMAGIPGFARTSRAFS